MSAGSVGAKAVASNILTQALGSIFAVAENYPQLKANENFLRLQTRISSLENQIADRREFYNDSVTAYNIRIHSLPDLMIAKILHYQEEELFKASSQEKDHIQTKW
jgi:LemA protein